MKHEDVAKQIIKNVGGAENINNAWHCMTRLRFNLKDEKQVNYAELEKIAEVVGTKYQSDQLQVVIGTNVADYFGPIVKVLGLDENNQQADGEKKEQYPYSWTLFLEYSDQLFQRLPVRA